MQNITRAPPKQTVALCPGMHSDATVCQQSFETIAAIHWSRVRDPLSPPSPPSPPYTTDTSPSYQVLFTAN